MNDMKFNDESYSTHLIQLKAYNQTIKGTLEIIDKYFVNKGTFKGPYFTQDTLELFLFTNEN